MQICFWKQNMALWTRQRGYGVGDATRVVPLHYTHTRPPLLKKREGSQRWLTARRSNSNARSHAGVFGICSRCLSFMVTCFVRAQGTCDSSSQPEAFFSLYAPKRTRSLPDCRACDFASPVPARLGIRAGQALYWCGSLVLICTASRRSSRVLQLCSPLSCFIACLFPLR